MDGCNKIPNDTQFSIMQEIPEVPVEVCVSIDDSPFQMVTEGEKLSGQMITEIEYQQHTLQSSIINDKSFDQKRQEVLQDKTVLFCKQLFTGELLKTTEDFQKSSALQQVMQISEEKFLGTISDTVMNDTPNATPEQVETINLEDVDEADLQGMKEVMIASQMIIKIQVLTYTKQQR